MKQHKIEMDPASLKIITLPINGHNVKITSEQAEDITEKQVQEWADFIRSIEGATK
jgi:hypothetical protein